MTGLTEIERKSTESADNQRWYFWAVHRRGPRQLLRAIHRCRQPLARGIGMIACAGPPETCATDGIT
jgi:hypothetical protein